ncbi:hypothetical protein [Arthrobacter sp. AQ5-05]|uniref:hypothetical protein n=1 Tax=Arthrobacter sp. AQ5-05 TaxID=2184581 RepID=UPI0018A78D9C|nr:hypothetical protein [Arthrobacter sp. AQ5-05]
MTGHWVLLADKTAVAVRTGMSTLTGLPRLGAGPDYVPVAALRVAALPDDSSQTLDFGSSLDEHSRRITLARWAYVKYALLLSAVLRPACKTGPHSVPP